MDRRKCLVGSGATVGNGVLGSYALAHTASAQELELDIDHKHTFLRFTGKGCSHD